MDHENDLELLKQNFPYVTCYCELCDCGRHRHHKDCVKSKKKGTPTKYQPLTDYQATFKAYKHAKPRSSKRPPRERHIVPPPLDGATVQREEYKPIDVEKHGRPPAFHRSGDYKGPTVPFGHKSYYQVDYLPKPLEIVEHEGPKSQTFTVTEPGKFTTTTTNKEYYKNWHHPHAQISFTEPPSFMASMLFPSNKQEEVKSVMRQSYPGKTAKKSDPARIPIGNIQMDGDHDHLTVNRDVYRGKPGHRSEIIIHSPELGKTRSSFHGETQNNVDFIRYGVNAGRRRPVSPAPATIDLRFNNRQNFDTEQRVTYKGHDTRLHPAPKASRTDFIDYHTPTVPFETKTSQKVDYIPRNLLDASQERAKMPQSQMDHGGLFHSETTNKHYYKNWNERKHPQRHGDFLDGINSMYLPPTKRFDATTTQRSEYQAKNTEMRPNMKPIPNPMAAQGSHDFETVHKLTYKGEKPRMCKAEAFLLQQELKRRLAEEGIKGSSLAQSIQPGQTTKVC